MTIKKRLAQSNFIMLLIPILVAGILLALGMGAALILLDKVYLPRLGISFIQLREIKEDLEPLLRDAKILACIYAGTVVLALIATIVLTNLYLTRRLFRHISEPLDILTAGVAKIEAGNLDAPISYQEPDEFQPACDAVDEMAARLKASLDAQQREQQQKQELIVGMSHDLKSPLTSIRAYTEALMEGVAADETAKKRYLATIHAKELELETMLSRLLTFAKSGSGDAPNLTAINLGDFVRNFTENWKQDGISPKVSIPVDLLVMADETLLARILENLLENCKKYGGRDDLSVWISAQKAEKMSEISVSDNGCGVAPEQITKIFDLFYRTDAARSHPGSGSGIGLAAVKQAAEQMGGSVRAENRVGGGLCVTVCLPMAGEEEDG